MPRAGHPWYPLAHAGPCYLCRRESRPHAALIGLSQWRYGSSLHRNRPAQKESSGTCQKTTNQSISIPAPLEKRLPAIYQFTISSSTPTTQPNPLTSLKNPTASTKPPSTPAPQPSTRPSQDSSSPSAPSPTQPPRHPLPSARRTPAT